MDTITPLVAMRRPQGERIAGRFWMASWLSPLDPETGIRTPYTRVFDVRRDALEFAHRRRAKSKVDVIVAAFKADDIALPYQATRTGLRLYRPGQAPEETGDV